MLSELENELKFYEQVQRLVWMPEPARYDGILNAVRTQRVRGYCDAEIIKALARAIRDVKNAIMAERGKAKDAAESGRDHLAIIDRSALDHAVRGVDLQAREAGGTIERPAVGGMTIRDVDLTGFGQ